MKRFYVLAGLGLCFALLSFASPLAAAPLLPDWPDIIDFSGGLVPALQMIISVSIVAAAVAFDLLSHNLGRTSILIDTNTELIARTRSFVRRSLNPLSEVQRSGRGTVAISGV
jgi:hypothetical protein